MHSQPRFKIDWAFWLQWVAATAVGLVVGVNAGFTLNVIVAGSAGTDAALVVYVVTLGVLVGAAVGSLQWLVLRRRFDDASRWIVASMAGWVAGWFIGGSIVGVISGTLIGLLQWVVLRRWVEQAVWWIAASTIAWTLGALALDTIGALLIGTLAVAVAGAVAGTLTGGALLWLMRQPLFIPDLSDTAKRDSLTDRLDRNS